MLKHRATLIPIVASAVVAAMAGHLLTSGTLLSTKAQAQAAAPVAQWAASATGRVEPATGEIRLSSPQPGTIAEVLVDTNDAVRAGDLLVRLDDNDILSKISAARAEVSVREREREEETATGLGVDRRKAEDALAAAERILFDARQKFDEMLRAAKAGDTKSGDLAAARRSVETAEADVASKRKALMTLNALPQMPQSQRLEASLAVARAELASLEVALEKTRIRAPIDGTVLNLIGKAGELAAPSPEAPLVVIGDISSLKVRAEVEERDAGKVKVGQGVVVKSDAYPNETFTGTVTSISQALGAPRIAVRGPRRPTDVEVIEAVIALDGSPPLLTGMRVDVFFKNDEQKKAAAAATSN